MADLISPMEIDPEIPAPFAIYTKEMAALCVRTSQNDYYFPLDKHRNTDIKCSRYFAARAARRARAAHMGGRKEVVFERVREIICDQLDLDEDRVTMDSNLLEDFDADSLDIVDLSMTLEDEFGLEMPDDKIEDFHTVGDVVRYIEENT